jgi:putative copper export protein
VRNDGVNVLGGKPRIAGGDRIDIPLQPGLDAGDYSVRWSVVSDDGHEEEGIVAFGVGTTGPPVSVLSTEGSATWLQVAMRTLLFIGVLGAAGAAFFCVFVLGGAMPRRQAHLMFAFFVCAFAGADALIDLTAASGTRFEEFMIVVAVASGIGAAASALVPLEPRLRYLGWVAATVLFPCPTLAGHAFDADQSKVIAPAADLLHLGGAAVWFGGVASLAVARTGTVQRFAQYALPAVVVVAIAGAARAITEFSAVSQLWTTSYGLTLIAKTVVFAALLALVWLGRRRHLLVQLVFFVALVAAVGTLTDLRPGRARSQLASQSNVPTQAAEPPHGVFVDAAQAGKLDVGFAWVDGAPKVTLVGPDGAAVTNVPVTTSVSGHTATVTVDGHSHRFGVPLPLRSAAAALARARALYDAAPAVTIRERLSSQPGNLQVTVFHERAPHSLAYTIVSSTQKGVTGTQAVVIGTERWDRVAGGRFRRSPQSVLNVPVAYWGPAARNAYWIGPHELAFYDPQPHAWYRLRLDASGRPAELMMIAPSHFMHHVYSFRSPPISAPR